EAVAAMRIQTGIRGVPGRLAGEQLGHVRLGAALLVRVEQPGRLEAHQVGRFEPRMGLRNRELHALVCADRSPEYHARAAVATGPLNEPAAVADRLRGDQDPLGV